MNRLITIIFDNLFSQKCETKNATSFAEYIAVLKLVKNAGVRGYEMLRPVYNALFKFGIERPEFFKKNLQELFEVDSLHQKMFPEIGARFWKEENITW